MVVIIIGALSVQPSFSQLATPSDAPEVWVNWAWISNSSGDVVDADGHVFGDNAFAYVNDGVYNVQAGGIVHVAPGLYPENVTIQKPLTMLGSYAGVSGTDEDRALADESVIGGS